MLNYNPLIHKVMYPTFGITNGVFPSVTTFAMT